MSMMYDKTPDDFDWSFTAKASPRVEDPCPGCKPGATCRTPKCGRLRMGTSWIPNMDNYTFPNKPAYPSKYPATFSDEELLMQEVVKLRKRVKELEKQVSDLNWTLYPDRMGQ